MAKKSNPLAGQLEALIARRAAALKEVAETDAKLKRIEELLGVSQEAATPTPSVDLGLTAAGRKRKRRRFAVSGEQFILNFVARKGGATTREVNVAWKKEGRGGTADTPLSKLVKEKQLKRIEVEGVRGSRYEVL